MRKLRLDLDELQVESFATQAGAGASGTVAGHADLIGAGNEIDVTVKPVTNDAVACMESWINTCVTAKLSECPGETCNQVTCGASCQVTCETCWGPTCASDCLATCMSGGPICCA